jgi:hypothetical protein
VIARDAVPPRNILAEVKISFSKFEPLHATEMNGDEYAFRFRERNYVKIHSKISITDIQFSIISHKRKARPSVQAHQLIRIM